MDFGSLKQPASKFAVQVESPQGMCPFLVETDETDARFTTSSIDETVATLTRLLHLEKGCVGQPSEQQAGPELE